MYYFSFAGLLMAPFAVSSRWFDVRGCRKWWFFAFFGHPGWPLVSRGLPNTLLVIWRSSWSRWDHLHGRSNREHTLWMSVLRQGLPKAHLPQETRTGELQITFTTFVFMHFEKNKGVWAAWEHEDFGCFSPFTQVASSLKGRLN